MPQVKLLGKTLELENPNQPTEQDILTIKNTFKIPQEFTLDQTRGALSQMIDAQTAGSRNIAADIPEQFPPGSPEYNNLMAEKIADINNRVELSNDPLKYISNNLADKYLKIPGTDFSPVPDDIISKPSFEMVGGFSGLLAVGGKDFLTRGVMFNPTMYAAGEYGGTMVGGQIYDRVNDFLRYAMDLEPKELEENISQFEHDAYMNLAFTGGSMVIAPIYNAFKRKIGQLTFGINPKSESYKKQKELADQYGIPFSIVQATNYGLWKAYPKVIGVFPWVGKPFKTQQEAIDESLRQYLSKMQNGLAPTQTIFNLSGDITNIFKNNYKDVRTAQGILFDDFYQYAEKLRGKKIIDITSFKARASDVADRFMGNTPAGRQGVLRFPGDAAQQSFGTFYNGLKNLPDQITLEQAISMRQMFSDFTANFQGAFPGGKIPVKEASALNKLSLVFEKDFMTLKNVDNAIDKAVFDTAQKKYATAVDFFANTMSRFEGGVPGQIKMAKPSIFSPGAEASGMMYTDEAFKVLLERAKNSKEAMEALINLSQPTSAELKAYAKAGNKDGVLVDGIEIFTKDMDPKSPTFEQYVKKKVSVVSAGPQSSKKRIMRKLIDNALFKSIKETPAGTNYQDFIDERHVSLEAIRQDGLQKAGPNMVQYKDVIFGVKQFEEALGLDNPDGIEILNTLLKDTGTSVQNIRQFLQAADDAGSFVVPDASTFLQRRLTLTGFRGLLLLNAGKRAAEGGLALTNIMIPLIMRYGSELLTDPQALKAMTEVLDTRTVSASNMTTLLNWASASGMPKDSDEIEQLERIKEIDSAVFNLMKTPQKDIEFDKARDEQFDMIRSGRLNQGQADIQNYLNQMFDQPSIPVSGPNDMSNFAAQPNQLSKAVQSELATGTLDDAINQKMLEKGLGSLQ